MMALLYLLLSYQLQILILHWSSYRAVWAPVSKTITFKYNYWAGKTTGLIRCWDKTTSKGLCTDDPRQGLTTILIKEVSLFGFDDCRVQNTKYLVKEL